jgi:hypothetical protein
MEELKQRTNSFIKKMTNLGLDSLSFTMVEVDMHLAGFLTSSALGGKQLGDVLYNFSDKSTEK